MCSAFNRHAAELPMVSSFAMFSFASLGLRCQRISTALPTATTQTTTLAGAARCGPIAPLPARILRDCRMGEDLRQSLFLLRVARLELNRVLWSVSVQHSKCDYLLQHLLFAWDAQARRDQCHSEI